MPLFSQGVGYCAVLVATLFFGSNFVPVKRYETHDGMFYQWVMCAGIFLVGLIVQLLVFAWPEPGDRFDIKPVNTSMLPNFTTANETEYLDAVTAQLRGLELVSSRGDPYSVKFMPMAAFGGFLWATGNTLSVPVINLIGLGLGILTWGSANMLMGWATGLFGLFVGYEHRDILAHPVRRTAAEQR
jgi:hypothetical protein